MTLRDLLEQHGVDLAALLGAPLAGLSLAERREQRLQSGTPQAYTDAQQTEGTLEVTITVPLFDGKARPAPASEWTIAVTPVVDPRTGEPNGVTAYELRSPEGQAAGEGHTYPSGGAVVEHPLPDPWEPENREESLDATELRARAKFYWQVADDLDARHPS